MCVLLRESESKCVACCVHVLARVLTSNLAGYILLARNV